MNRICYMAVWCYCQLTCFRNRNKKAMFCHGIVIKRNVFKNLKSRDKALKMEAISIVAERFDDLTQAEHIVANMVSDGNEAVRSHALISMLDIKDRKGFISNDALMHMKQALGYYPEDELQQSFVRGLECTENNQMAGHFQMPKNLPRHDCTSRIPGKSGEGMDDPEPFILTAETRLKTRFPAKYRAFLASEVSEINNYLFFVVHDPCHFKLLLLKCNNYWETTEMLAIGIDPRNETFGILKRFLDLDDPPVHRFRHEENQFVELSSSFSSFIERIKSNQRN